MSYQLTLEKAGANVISFKEFGCYQGSWYAFVEYQGEKGIVEGSYGSCSGCDSFYATFDYEDEPHEKNGKYYSKPYCHDGNEITKEEFDQAICSYNNKLAEFGKDYLRAGLYDKKHYEDRLSKIDPEDWFDQEEKEGIEWCINQKWQPTENQNHT